MIIPVLWTKRLPSLRQADSFIHMAQKIIHRLDKIPESFADLNSNFRKCGYAMGRRPRRQGGAVCSHIFGSTIGRLCLMESIEETFERHITVPIALEMINDNEALTEDAVSRRR
jgi:hypothetical protein